MSAIEYLRHMGPHTAAQIAQALDVPVVSVYEELVAAESAGLVRVNVEFQGDQNVRYWEAM